MNVLVIAPVKTEYHAAREVFAATEIPVGPPGKMRLARRRFRNSNIFILMTGIGFSFLIDEKTILDLVCPDIIIDSGSCGSLNDALPQGCLVQSTSALSEEGFTYTASQILQGSAFVQACFLEVDQPVTMSERRDQLHRRYKADICSMESFHAASLAARWGCKWDGFRIVTDMADSSAKSEFKKRIREYSLILYENIFSVLEKSILKPAP